MARRRANGQGTVYLRKDGRWEGAGYVLTAEGGSRRVRVYGATRDEAQSKLDAALAQSAKGIAVGGATVAQYVTSWLETVAAHRLRPTTMATYRHYVHAYIVPGLGDKTVHQLTVKDVRTWLDRVRGQCQCCTQGWDAKRDPQHKRRAQRPRCCAIGQCCTSKVSAGTIAYLRAILSSALAHAMREDDLTRNVASAVRLGQTRSALFEPLTAAEARKLLDAAALNRWRVVFELALRTGLRRGELLGLKWTDIDFSAGSLTVARTLQRTAQGLQLFPTKTVGSQRRILLPTTTQASLVEHRRRQEAERQGHQAGWNPQGLVFVTLDGGPLDPGALNRNLTTLCEMAGIRRIRFHDLRHSCATLLLEQGVELVTIKELLGHAQIHTTADVYAHVRLRLQRGAIEAMDRALKEGDDSMKVKPAEHSEEAEQTPSDEN